MKKFYDIGRVNPSFRIHGLQVDLIHINIPEIHWSFVIYDEWLTSEEDLLIRSPLFHYCGDRYFTAELRFEEGYVICTGLSITRCSRDERDFRFFSFEVGTAYYRLQLLDIISPGVHGGRFLIHDFKAREKKIGGLDGCNKCISFVCCPVKSPSPIQMPLLPRKNKTYEYKEMSTQTDVNNDAKNLGQNLKNLLLNEQDHDLVLKVQDKEFRAHRCILRARSSVMGSMLSHDMIEKNGGVIDIPDCDPGTFEQFRTYLYSGEVETLDEGNMLALYDMADKYDVEHLKKRCREFIQHSLTSANLSGVIQFALDHNDEDLLEYATGYFMKNATLVLRTVEWMSFATHSPILANELSIKAFDTLTVKKK